MLEKTSKDKYSDNIKINLISLMKMVKNTIYSEEFQKELNAYKNKTGKTDLSSKEILDIYSKFLKK